MPSQKRSRSQGGSMSQAKRRRVFRRRKSRKTRGRRRGRRMQISYAPVPDRTFTKMKYVDFVNLNPSAAGTLGMVSYSFRTSIFDPDYTGLGHQPLWHDTYLAMYGSYRVYGIKYSIAFANTNTSQLCTCAIQHSTDPPESSAVGFTTILERRGTRVVTVGSNNDRPTIVSGYMATHKPYGMTKKEFIYDEDFDSVNGANPNKASFLNIYATTLNTSAVINTRISLTYYVEFQRRAKAAQS